MKVEENQIILCTVKRIDNTTVFLEIEGNGEGSMNLSEVAAGRIRNLREYVFPNKKIVCKVLKISNDRIELSLRRVTGKEKFIVLEQYKKEKIIKKILSSNLKNSEEIIEKIKEKYSLADFFDLARENPLILNEVMKKEDAQKIAVLFAEKKEKEKESKKFFILKSSSENGLEEIKNILIAPQTEISYLGSSQFSIKAKGKEFKDANSKVETALKQIEKKAKEKKMHFEIKERV